MSDRAGTDAGGVNTSDGSTSWARTGRVLGTVLSVVWLLVLLAGLIAGDDEFAVDEEGATAEGVVLTALVLAAIAGFALSLRRPHLGGRIILAAGSLLCIFAVVTAGRNHWLAVLVSGAPWLVVGASILLAARRHEHIGV